MSLRLSSRLALGGLAAAALAVPIGIASADTDGDAVTEPACGAELAGDPFVRTELFFGLSRPGGRISQRQFDRFVDDKITPRFPDGLTLLSGRGQFRLDDGDIVEEGSKVLVLLHEVETAARRTSMRSAPSTSISSTSSRCSALTRPRAWGSDGERRFRTRWLRRRGPPSRSP
jgi:hypothetical protein